VVQGTLPVDYLVESGEFSSQNIFANARQILQQYNVSIVSSLCDVCTGHY